MNKEKVFDYINAVKQERDLITETNEIQESTNVKLRIIADNTEKCRKDVICTLLGKIYIQSLPLDDEYKDSHEDELVNDIHDCIEGKGGVKYIMEAIRKTNSNKLQKIVETADKISSRYGLDKEVNVSLLSSKDLDYKPSDEDKKDINDTIEDLETEDIADIIRDNVKTTIMSEIDRAKKHEEAKAKLEENLALNDNIRSDEDIDQALEENPVAESTFYEGTLFEAMMMKYTNDYIKEGAEIEFANDAALNRSTRDLTKLTLLNTLMLESYSPKDLNNIRDQYLNEA